MSQVQGECGSSVQLKQNRRPQPHSGSQKGSPSTRTAVPQCGTLRRRPRALVKYQHLKLTSTPSAGDDTGGRARSPCAHGATVRHTACAATTQHTTRGCGSVRPHYPDFCQYLWRQTLLLTLSR